MSKPKIPNQKKKYQELNTRLNKYVALVEHIYDVLNLEAAKAVLRTDYSSDSENPFKWSDYPQTKKRIYRLNLLIIFIRLSIEVLVKNGKIVMKCKT